jgi:hypothetical protein
MLRWNKLGGKVTVFFLFVQASYRKFFPFEMEKHSHALCRQPIGIRNYRTTLRRQTIALCCQPTGKKGHSVFRYPHPLTGRTKKARVRAKNPKRNKKEIKKEGFSCDSETFLLSLQVVRGATGFLPLRHSNNKEYGREF